MVTLKNPYNKGNKISMTTNPKKIRYIKKTYIQNKQPWN